MLPAHFDEVIEYILLHLLTPVIGTGLTISALQRSRPVTELLSTKHIAAPTNART